jgi:hypothetical protein
MLGAPSRRFDTPDTPVSGFAGPCWAFRDGALALAGLAKCLTRPFALLPVLGFLVIKALARAYVEPPQAAILSEIIDAPRLPDAIRLQKACRALSGALKPFLAAL